VDKKTTLSISPSVIRCRRGRGSRSKFRTRPPENARGQGSITRCARKAPSNGAQFTLSPKRHMRRCEVVFTYGICDGRNVKDMK
jgi:hypothetical protein